MKRVVINKGSSINILYFNSFLKLKLTANDLTLMSFLLMGFTNDSISLLWTVNLYFTFGNELCSKIILARFMMVDISSKYNAIIG